MSKVLRWFLQLILSALLAVILYSLINLIREGGTPRDFLILTMAAVMISGLIWAAKLIGDPAIRSAEWQARFNSPDNPIMRHYKLIMATLAIIGLIANLLAGPGHSAP